MSGLSRRIVRNGFRALPLAGLGASVLAVAQAAATEVPMSALKACAAISAAADRLACYDRLAGRPTAPAQVPAAAPPAAAPAAAPAAIPAAAPPAAAPAATTAAAPPKESFGLYSAEHPTAPKPESSHSAKVVDLGVSYLGRPTVTLEGGELWELDGPDPILKSGDSVTIKRATLGSFLMTTPSGRTHRVHQLR